MALIQRTSRLKPSDGEHRYRIDVSRVRENDTLIHMIYDAKTGKEVLAKCEFSGADLAALDAIYLGSRHNGNNCYDIWYYGLPQPTRVTTPDEEH